MKGRTFTQRASFAGAPGRNAKSSSARSPGSSTSRSPVRPRGNQLLPLHFTLGVACLVFLLPLYPVSSRPPDASSALSRDEQVASIAKELEADRGRSFLTPVPVRGETAEEFRAFVDKELALEYPGDKARRQARVLEAFGIVSSDYDIRAGLSDLYVSQAGAYYDPERKTFYVLKAGLPDDQMDVMLRHELVHAMQDQYHDLGTKLKSLREAANEDQRAAFQYLIEGEASYLMYWPTLKKMGLNPLTGDESALERFYGRIRKMSRGMLLAAAKLSQPRGKEGAEIRKALDALEEVPPYMFHALHDPYLKGQYAVYRVHKALGWTGVDGLFERLPQSTEQMLHPEKLLTEPDLPQEVTLPSLKSVLPEGWNPVDGNTMGEAGMLAWLEQLEVKDKEAASEGWDGDAYIVYEGPKGRLLLVWKCVFDADKDAQEFGEVLRALKPGTFCGGQKDVPTLRIEGSTVLLVAGPNGSVQQALSAFSDAARGAE